MGLETIVRPYQLPQTTTDRLLFQAGQKDAAPVKLEIGKNGGGFKQMNGSESFTQTFYQEKADVELKLAHSGGAGSGSEPSTPLSPFEV